jgi:hypothetical protein
MHTSRSILCSAIASAIVAAAPLPATAKDAAMDACIQAFIAERVPKDRAVQIRKSTASSSFAQSRAQRITLTAHGAKSGTEIASATCVVDSSGASISLRDI